MNSLLYDEMELQQYLNDPSINPQLGQSIFRWRTRMFNFKKNFRNGNDDISCKFGCDSFDSQEHSLNCVVVKTQMKDLSVTVSQDQYNQLFSKNVTKVKDMAILLNKAYKVRESLLESMAVISPLELESGTDGCNRQSGRSNSDL